MMHLAQIYKRDGELQNAIPLWEQAAQFRHLQAHLELSKAYEHRYKDFDQAVHWTLEALALLEDARLPLKKNTFLAAYERQRWQTAFNHRLERLKNKAANQHGS
jgi:hypothetical protein